MADLTPLLNASLRPAPISSLVNRAVAAEVTVSLSDNWSVAVFNQSCQPAWTLLIDAIETKKAKAQIRFFLIIVFLYFTGLDTGCSKYRMGPILWCCWVKNQLKINRFAGLGCGGLRVT